MAGKEKIMIPKFFYGQEAKLTAMDKRLFDRNGFICTDILTTDKGEPMIISGRHEDGTWKLQYGFSTILFSGRKEALNYCRKRFPGLKGV